MSWNNLRFDSRIDIREFENWLNSLNEPNKRFIQNSIKNLGDKDSNNFLSLDEWNSFIENQSFHSQFANNNWLSNVMRLAVHTNNASNVQLVSNYGLENQPTEQDLIAERNYFSFTPGRLGANILSPRRQTEQMVLESEKLLPQEIRDNTTFILTERLVQRPTDIAEELKNRRKIVLIGSFEGVKRVDNWNAYNSNDDNRKELHFRELARLKESLEIIKQINPTAEVEVVYGMGDSVNQNPGQESFGNKIRNQLQLELAKTINEFNQTNSTSIITPQISWGADELVLQAMAKQIPTKSAFVYISNPNATNYWDAGATTQEVLNEQASATNISLTNDFTNSDLKVFIITRKPGLPQSRTNLEEQREYNMQILDHIGKTIQNLSPEELRKVTIIDSVFPAGSSIELSDIKEILVDKYQIDISLIHWSSWGTAGNNLGQAFGEQKIRIAALNNSSQNNNEIMIAQSLQAFAHDFIFNNETVKDELNNLFIKNGIQGIDATSPDFDYWQLSPETINQIHPIIESFINEKLTELLGNSFSNLYRIKLTYQFSRNYEAVVQLVRKHDQSVVIDVPITQNSSYQSLQAFSAPESNTPFYSTGSLISSLSKYFNWPA